MTKLPQHLEDDFDSLSSEEIEAADALFESTRTIQAHALYFINTGKFYAEHKQMRDALNLFLERTTKAELQSSLDELAFEIRNWIRSKKDYSLNFMGSDLKLPNRKESELIAAEIIDHWTERKLTKEINKLLKEKV